MFFNGGVDGEFGNGYRWSLGLVHSSAQLSQAVNNLNNGRLFASLDATQVTAATWVARAWRSAPSSAMWR